MSNPIITAGNDGPGEVTLILRVPAAAVHLCCRSLLSAIFGLALILAIRFDSNGFMALVAAQAALDILRQLVDHRLHGDPKPFALDP